MNDLAQRHIANLERERAWHLREVESIDKALNELCGADAPDRVWTGEVVAFKQPARDPWPFVEHRTMQRVSADESGPGDAA